MTYLFASLVVMATAALVTYAWPGLIGGLDRAIGWFVLVPTLITLVALGFGLVGWLSATAMLLAHVALLVVGGLLAWRRRRRTGQPFQLPPLRWRAALRRPWLWLLAAAGAAALGWLLYAGLIVPPYGWDGLSYHLPPAVWWLQAGRIYPVPTQFTFGYAYPQGMSILLMWQLAFTRTDHLVNIVQVPFILLGTLAAYGVAREAGLGRKWAWWAGAFWGLAPIVLEQAVVPYNDVSVTALTLAAAYFALRYRRCGRLGPLGLAGVAVGLLLGIKPNGFLVAGLIGVVALLPLHRRAYSLRRVSARVLAVVLPSLILAGYWYIRNLVLYHNPLFPAAVTVLGHTIFAGPRTIASLIDVTPDQSRWQTLRMALHEWTSWYSYDTPNAGFGPVFTMLGVGAIGATVLYALLRRRWRLFWITAGGLLLLLLQPFKYPRYIAFLPALAGLGFGVVLQHLAPRKLRAPLELGATGLMLLTLVFVPYQPQLSAETIWQVRTARAEGRSISSAEFGLARKYGFIDAMPELDDPANRIAYAEGGFVYPLMGRDRQNHIYYVPTTSMEEWLKGIDERQTTFVIIANDKAVEHWWIKQNPQRFTVWARPWPFTVYLVKSDLPRNQALLKQMEGGGHS